MNRLFNYVGIICCTATLLCLTSCSTPGSEEETIDLLPVQTSQEGRWSMIDNKGNIVYDSEFDETPTMAINGYFSVKENNGYNLYKIGGKTPEAVKGCENLNAVGIMTDNLVPVVRPGKRIEIVNKSGETEFELSPVDNVEIFECKESFSDGLLCVMTAEGKYGFVNKKGKYVIPCIYDAASSFENGYAIVGKKENDSDLMMSCYVIDTSGDQVVELGSHSICPDMFYGYINTTDEDQNILIDMDGDKHKLPSKVRSLREMKGDLIIYSDDNGNYGMVNLDGETIIRAKYCDLHFAFNGDLIAQKTYNSHEIQILDTKGEEKQTVDLDNIYVIDGFGYLGVEGNVYTVINEEFKETSKEEFYNRSAGRYSGTIQSDYVNREHIADTFVNSILNDGTGIKDAKFGETAESLMSGVSPKDYTYKTEIKFKTKDVNMACSMEGKFFLTERMAEYEYNYGSYEYKWNPNSKLGKILLTMECPKGWKMEGHTAVVNAMKKKGFSLVKEGMIVTGYAFKHTYGFCTLMKNGNVIAVLMGLDESSKILLVTSSIFPQAEEFAKEIIFGKYVADQDGNVNQSEAAAMEVEGIKNFDTLQALPVQE